jgi:predicted GTPase
VVSATPIDLGSLVRIEKPMVRVTYEYMDHGAPTLAVLLEKRLKTSKNDPPVKGALT